MRMVMWNQSIQCSLCGMVAILKRRCPGFATMRHWVLSFRGILCRGKVSSFRRWVEKAEATGLEAIGRFVRHLRKDWAEVENEVRHAWSNEPVEGMSASSASLSD